MSKNNFKLILLSICLYINPSWSAVPAYSLEELEKYAIHIIEGKVVSIASSGGLLKRKVYQIEVEISKVTKGTGIKIKDKIKVLTWNNAIFNLHIAKPQGHGRPPKKGDQIIVYINNKDKNGFNAIMPNGIFSLKEHSNSKKSRKRSKTVSDIQYLKRF